MSLNNYIKNKDRIWMHFGNKCARCGCTDNLQLDHKDPLTKKFDVTAKLGGKLGPLWEEVHKCQLLCKACHDEKTKEDHESIQSKRKEFIHYEYRFDPILQEEILDVKIDTYKKNGKAFVKYCEFMAERRGIDFKDFLLEQVEETQKYDIFKDWKDWDELEIHMSNKGVPPEKIKKLKDYLERENLRMKKEEPKLVEKFIGIYEQDDGEYKSKISFTKMIDEMIDFYSKYTDDGV